MSYVQSNMDIFQMMPKTRSFSDEEVPSMSIEQFDKLTLAEQIHIYNHFPSEYERLTGDATDTATDTTATTPQESDAERFAREFEQRVDQAITRVFHPNGVD